MDFMYVVDLVYRVSMVVSVRGLTKVFGKFRAVDDVTFAVRQGEIVGLVGPNGAGKTTTIHMVLGLISPTSGDILLFGKQLEKHREEILQRLNFTSPYMAFPTRLTVQQNLKVFAGIYNVPDPATKIGSLLEQFGIAHLESKPVSRLSSGENTRVALCKGFLNDPELLLLDEPTAYLDPEAAIHVRETLMNLQQVHSTTILYASHNMREIQKMCSRVIFLSHGRILASGTAMEVTRTILEEDRDVPALEEVFSHLAKRRRHEHKPH
jgi:ABC-2 type transport system ATP-binding protein